jgi:hypothetical protein
MVNFGLITQVVVTAIGPSRQHRRQHTSRAEFNTSSATNKRVQVLCNAAHVLII